MNRSSVPVAMVVLLAVIGCSAKPTASSQPPSTSSVTTAPEAVPMSDPKNQVRALLESIQTGAREPAAAINPEKYTQHNLAVADGMAGFGQALQALDGSGKARVLRVFQDGDFVFAHTEYDFFGPKAGFDLFRFEDGRIVEHWDNLQPIAGPNPSGRTMFDGPTEATHLADTEANKAAARSFVEAVLIGGDFGRLGDFIGPVYRQHNPNIADGLDGLGAALEAMAAQGVTMEYHRLHGVFGEGDFVLTIAEGTFGGAATSFYDLFRFEDGQIVEHWDVIETIAPKSEWKHDNGKFGGL